MVRFLRTQHKPLMKTITGIVLAAFCLTNVPSYALAQTFAQMPAPGQAVALTPAFAPALIKGLCVDPQNPFKFDFIVDVGDSGLEGEAFNEETMRLIKYFLASLTIPEKDLWVNLSPYEKDRIVPESFGATDMGRDLLAQDYLLKQLTASLTSPETAVGKAFWEKVYKQAYEKFGTTQVPTDTFNKVWIIPDKAKVYENGDKAFVVESKLKVMLESDYVATQHNRDSELAAPSKTNELSSQIVRDIVLPELEKEVNEGKSFATLRQVYLSFILATWFKQTLKESILNKKYSDQKKTDGLMIANTNETNEIYAKYLEAYKKGVCNMLKVERDPYTNKNVPRKYFSGGMRLHLSSSTLVTTRIFSDVKEYIKTHGEKRLRKVLITLEDLAWRAQDAVRPVKNPDPQISRDRSLLTPNEVHNAIEEGLPGEFKDFSSLSPGEKEKHKDNYRDRHGRIVIRVEGLYAKTKLLGHIVLGQDYGEPVIYLDPALNLDQLRVVKAHEEYMIEQWEKFRKEREYTYQQMREWIKENSSRQGTGEAQKMARQWDREAPSIEHVYQELFFANLTDTDREKQFKFQQARIKRMTRDIIRALKKYIKDHQLFQIPLGKTTYDAFWNEKAINFIIANVEKKSTSMAVARYKTGTIGALLDFVLSLTDSQLAHVIGHELTHQFIKKGVLTLGVNGNFDSQNLFNTYLAEENPRLFQEIKETAMQEEVLEDTATPLMSPEGDNALRGYRSQLGEKVADYMGVLLMTVGGFSPFEAEGMMRGLPTFKSPNLLPDTASERVNYKAHPDLKERLEIVRAAVERYKDLAVGDIYDTDVVSAVEPEDSVVGIGSSASPIGSTLDISDENEYMNYRDYKNYDAFLTRYGTKIQNTKTKEPLAETVQGLVDKKFGTNVPVRILDAGCGLGMSLVNLKFQYGRNVDLYGIDKKQSRIEDMGPKARQGLLEEYGPDVQEMYETMEPKISFFKGEEYDIATTKVEDENGAQVPMDFITALFVLQYLSDPLAGWSNLFHQLADGGTFVSQFLFVNDEEGLRNEAFYVSFFNEMRNRGVDIEMNVAELETDGKKTGERVLFVSAVRKGNQKITLNIKPVAVREITLPIEKENRSYTFNQVSYAQTAGGERIVISSGIETRTVDVLLEDYINNLTENLKEQKGKLADLIRVRSPNIVVEGQRSLIKKREERLLAAEKYVREIKKYLKDGTIGEFIKALKEIKGGALADELLSEDQKETLILTQKELKDFGFDPGMFLFIPIDSWVHGILHRGPVFGAVKGYHVVVLDHGQPVALNVIISDKSERRRLIRIVIHEFFHGEFDEGDVFLARRFSGQPDPAIVFLHHILNEAMTEDLTVETIGRLYGNLAADLGSTYINEREFLNGILSLPLRDNSAKEAVIKLLREGDPAFLQEIFGKDWDAFLSLLEIASSEGQLSHEAQLIFYMLSFLLKEGNGKDTIRLTNGLEFIKLVQETCKNIFETQDIFAGIKKYYGTARRLFEDLTIEQAFDTSGAIADRKDEIREKLLVASSGIGQDEGGVGENGEKNIFEPAKQAEFYDSFNGQPFIQAGDDRIALSMTTEDPVLRAQVAAKIKKIVPRNKIVLEVGAGQGHLAEALINEELRDITAIDISEKNVLAAQARVTAAAERKVEKPRVKIQQGDAYNLAFEKNRFDVVIFNESVGGLQDMEKAFAEAARVLRRGGLIIVTTYNKDRESLTQDARETHYLSHSTEAIKEALVKSGFENMTNEDILSAKAQGALSFFTATKAASSNIRMNTFNYGDLMSKGYAMYETSKAKLLFILRKFDERRNSTGEVFYLLDVVDMATGKPIAYMDFVENMKKNEADIDIRLSFSGFLDFEKMTIGIMKNIEKELGGQFGAPLEDIESFRRSGEPGGNALFIKEEYRSKGQKDIWNLDKLMTEIAFSVAANEGVEKFVRHPRKERIGYHKEVYGAQDFGSEAAGDVGVVVDLKNRKIPVEVTHVSDDAGKMVQILVQDGPQSSPLGKDEGGVSSSVGNDDRQTWDDVQKYRVSLEEKGIRIDPFVKEIWRFNKHAYWATKKSTRFLATTFPSARDRLGIEKKWNLPTGLTELDIQQLIDQNHSGSLHAVFSGRKYRQIIAKLWETLKELNPELERFTYVDDDIKSNPARFSPMTSNVVNGISSRYNADDIEFFINYWADRKLPEGYEEREKKLNERLGTSLDFFISPKTLDKVEKEAGLSDIKTPGGSDEGGAGAEALSKVQYLVQLISEIVNFKKALSVNVAQTGLCWAWIDIGGIHILDKLLALYQDNKISDGELAVLLAHEVAHEEAGDIIKETALVLANGQGLSGEQRKEMEIQRWIRAVEIIISLGYSYKNLETLQKKVQDGLFDEFNFEEDKENAENYPTTREVIAAVLSSQVWPVNRTEPKIGSTFKKGGIDLNAKNFELEREKVGEGVMFDAKNFENVEINGLTPVILNVTPVTNLYQLLGVREEEKVTAGS